jgi:hypothetical protein
MYTMRQRPLAAGSQSRLEETVMLGCAVVGYNRGSLRGDFGRRKHCQTPPFDVRKTLENPDFSIVGECSGHIG